MFAFGIADQTSVKDMLNAFIYCEHEGKKGGDNVVSCLWKFLCLKGIIINGSPPPVPIEELTFTFDNCPGQNKNRMVIRFAAYLVEAGFFSQVNLVFLVRGHTKNACDRLFNLLKVLYSQQNIFSSAHLMDVLNKSDDVAAHRMPEFFAWDDALEQLYKRPAGVTEKPHCFKLTVTKSGVLFYQDFDGEDWQEMDLKKRMSAEERAQLLASFSPAQVPAPGMKEIKRMELYSKWRQYVPKDQRTDWWFAEEPEQQLQKRVREDRTDRATARKNARTEPATGTI